MTVTVTFKSKTALNFSGLSTDTKPSVDVGFPNAWFDESDTGDTFQWKGGAWVQVHVHRQEFRLNIEAVRVGSTPPAIEVTESIGASGNILLPSLAFDPTGGGADEESFFVLHVPSNADGSVDTEFHLMWKPDSGWGSGNYRWVLEYLVKDEDADFTTGTPTTIFEDVTPSNANDGIETEFSSTIDAGPDQIILCRLSLEKAESSADDDGHVYFVELEVAVIGAA